MFRSTTAIAGAKSTRWGRREATLALTLAGACLVLSAALLPTHGATLHAPAATGTQAAAQKSDRLVPYVITSACSRDTWGSESLNCLNAISLAAGRSGIGPSRVVVALADHTRPNDFR